MLTIDRLTLSKISDNASQHFSTAHINLILPRALPHLSSLSLSALSLSPLFHYNTGEVAYRPWRRDKLHLDSLRTWPSTSVLNKRFLPQRALTTSSRSGLKMRRWSPFHAWQRRRDSDSDGNGGHRWGHDADAAGPSWGRPSDVAARLGVVAGIEGGACGGWSWRRRRSLGLALCCTLLY